MDSGFRVASSRKFSIFSSIYTENFWHHIMCTVLPTYGCMKVCLWIYILQYISSTKTAHGSTMAQARIVQRGNELMVTVIQLLIANWTLIASNSLFRLFHARKLCVSVTYEDVHASNFRISSMKGKCVNTH